ncbi:MAG: MerR family DNA-binding transcriptional regulator [Planctomycetes bacterium]|nr:MerR family DNA-binding transcriptional regulator [Planctomycetota bacterium]
MKLTLSPKELAQAIGVSESSLKRWADKGVIEVTRTAGGHRRIPVPEAIRFIRESRATLVDPRILGLSDLETLDSEHGASTIGDEAEQLYRFLVAGDAPRARGLILSLYLGGESVASICDGPVREAMHRIGELWQHDPSGVFAEHRATDICLQALNQLRLTLPAPQSEMVAVGGAPAGDPYLLPSLIAATVLAAEGFAAVNLGPDTPYETLLVAAREHRARLVWLSVSSEVDARAFNREVKALAQELAGAGVCVVVGGRRAEQLSLAPADNLYRGHSMGELVAFARGVLLGAGRRN